jgi:hypothetical protein
LGETAAPRFARSVQPVCRRPDVARIMLFAR